MPLQKLESFTSGDVTKAAELVLSDLVDNHKIRWSMARNVRVALTGKHTTANVHVGFLRDVLALIRERRHAIIDLLSQKTCLSETPATANATAIALLTETEGKIKTAISAQRENDRKWPQKKPEPTEKVNTSRLLETYRMAEWLTITISKVGDKCKIQILEHGEIIKDEFECAKYSVEEGLSRYLSVYDSHDTENPFWGYTILDDE